MTSLIKCMLKCCLDTHPSHRNFSFVTGWTNLSKHLANLPEWTQHDRNVNIIIWFLGALLIFCVFLSLQRQNMILRKRKNVIDCLYTVTYQAIIIGWIITDFFVNVGINHTWYQIKTACVLAEAKFEMKQNVGFCKWSHVLLQSTLKRKMCKHARFVYFYKYIIHKKYIFSPGCASLRSTL